MLKRMGMLAALMVMFSAYLVAGNEGAESFTFSQEFKVILLCIVASVVSGALWYAFTKNNNHWDD